MKTVIVTVVLGALIILVPLAFTSEGILTSASRQALAREVTEEWLLNQDGLQLSRLEVKGTEVAVIITGEGDIPPIFILNEELSESFGAPTIAQIEYFPSRVLTELNQP